LKSLKHTAWIAQHPDATSDEVDEVDEVDERRATSDAERRIQCL
jgi:hypothetical protein